MYHRAHHSKDKNFKNIKANYNNNQKSNLTKLDYYGKISIE